ncbi:MAG: hypothetical protein IJJ26_11645 [Victivallales bacterium]|nr:hypothetical protein [Victivallales bacterium]
MMLAALILEPVLPLWLLVLCGIAFGVLAWRSYAVCRLTLRQRWLLFSLRMAAFLVIAWLVCQPSLRRTRAEVERPAVAVVVDSSASMEDNPLAAPQSRAARAREYLRSSAFRKAVSGARVTYFSAGENLSEGWTEEMLSNSPRSFLSDNLSRLAARFRGDNLAGVILLSDGLDQSAQSFDPTLLGAPVFIPELEEPGSLAATQKDDFLVGLLAYPKRVILNWKTTISVTIQRRSGEGPATFPVQLRLKGSVLQTQNVEFAERENLRRLQFEVEPTEVGALVYEIRIDIADEEASNNRKEFLLDVTDAKQRILYLEGTPRWDFKFLKRSLLAEKNFQLSAYLRAGNGGFINFDETGAGAALPTLDEASLRPYRVVILGDLPAASLTSNEATALCKFVEKGGGLLFTGGVTSFSAQGVAHLAELEPLLPAKSEEGASMKEGRFPVDFTSEGRALSTFAALAEEVRFPAVLTLWGPVKPNGFATSYLASGEGSPVLLGRRYGQGRVAMLLSDSMWRWQLGSGASATKGLYGRFVTQLLHWLAPGQDEKDGEEALQALVADPEVEQYQKVVLGAIGAGKGKGAAVTCNITTPAGKKLSYPMLPGKLQADVGLVAPQDGFRLEILPEEKGTYLVEMLTADGTRRASLTLLSRFPEHEHTGAIIDRQFLRRLVSATGGRWTSWNQRNELLAELHLSPRTIQTTTEAPLWNRSPWIILLLALFCAEWFLRRKMDLV